MVILNRNHNNLNLSVVVTYAGMGIEFLLYSFLYPLYKHFTGIQNVIGFIPLYLL